MSSTINTPTFYMPRQMVPSSLQRRNTVTPCRPSTSDGEPIEPKSDFLREALRERNSLHVRAQSTTHRRSKNASRAHNNSLSHDEYFLPSSDDEVKTSGRRNPFRAHLQRSRRGSVDANISKSSSITQVRQLGVREADAQLDRLLKENWDLKHRLALQDDAFKKTQRELEAAREELDQSASWQQKNAELEEAINAISKQAAVSEEENQQLKVRNSELMVLNDDLMRELERKDDGIEQRQLAIQEAAGIIQFLEASLESARKRNEAVPKADSDYFSGDNESSKSNSPSKRLTSATTHLAESTYAPDSDYQSADSPGTRESMLRKGVTRDDKQRALQLQRARATASAFNREIGLRSQVSKDSLLASMLDICVPEPLKQAPRALRRRFHGVGTIPSLSVSEQSQASVGNKETIQVITREWTDSVPSSTTATIASSASAAQYSVKPTRNPHRVLPANSPADPSNLRLARSNTGPTRRNQPWTSVLHPTTPTDDIARSREAPESSQNPAAGNKDVSRSDEFRQSSGISPTLASFPPHLPVFQKPTLSSLAVPLARPSQLERSRTLPMQ